MSGPAPSKAALLALVANLQEHISAIPDEPSAAAPTVETLAAINATASQLTTLTTPPLAAALRIMTEPVRSAALRVAIDCGWLEVLTAAKRAVTAAELAAGTVGNGKKQSVKADKGLVVRLMRVLSSAGVLDEVGEERYAANGVTAVFCIEGIRDGATFWFDTWAPTLLHLPQHLAHFSYAEPTDAQTCTFAFAHGSSIWQYFVDRPSRRAAFDSYMTAHRAGRGRWVDAYPVAERLVSGFEAGGVMLVDIGGGWGHDLVDFARSEGAKGAGGRLVLQDLAEGLPAKGSARRAELEGFRVEVAVHDFFTEQPVKGARAYSFRSVLHDWPDKECRQILQNTIPAMKKGYSKILINDMVIPNQGAAPWQGWLDMVVMAGAAAKERSQRDWEELLDSVGLRIVGIYPMGEESLLEVELKA